MGGLLQFSFVGDFKFDIYFFDFVLVNSVAIGKASKETPFSRT